MEELGFSKSLDGILRILIFGSRCLNASKFFCYTSILHGQNFWDIVLPKARDKPGSLVEDLVPPSTLKSVLQPGKKIGHQNIMFLGHKMDPGLGNGYTGKKVDYVYKKVMGFEEMLWAELKFSSVLGSQVFVSHIIALCHLSQANTCPPSDSLSSILINNKEG